jgi:hypothetical protein
MPSKRTCGQQTSVLASVRNHVQRDASALTQPSRAGTVRGPTSRGTSVDGRHSLPDKDPGLPPSGALRPPGRCRQSARTRWAVPIDPGIAGGLTFPKPAAPFSFRNRRQVVGLGKADIDSSAHSTMFNPHADDRSSTAGPDTCSTTAPFPFAQQQAAPNNPFPKPRHPHWVQGHCSCQVRTRPPRPQLSGSPNSTPRQAARSAQVPIRTRCRGIAPAI